MTIKEQIVNLLKDSTKEVQAVCAEIGKLEKRKENDHLDARYIRETIDPQLFNLRIKLTELKDHAEVQLRNVAEKYREQVRNSHRLEGGEMTADAKLFGFPGLLKPEDIEAIMDRHPNNHTMLQLAVRYAEQNGMRINRAYDSGKAREIQNVNGLEGTGRIYLRNWIHKENADDMLGKFFE